MNNKKNNQNPFTIIFGMEPRSFIPRLNDYSQIISVFDSNYPRTFAYVITGVRGCGKTVLLTSVQNYFAEKDNWIVLRLNPDIDLYESAISQMSSHIKLPDETFSEINIFIAGFGGGMTKRSLSDNETILKKMLIKAKSEGKKVLMAIDEASNSDNLKTFSHSYQAFLGETLPVFLLMTALPENFHNLSNARNGTFLRRMPKIVLGELNAQMIRNSYMKIFDIPEKEAEILSKFVKGYSFAYQVLGDLLWESGGTSITEQITRDFDAILSDCVYLPIWNHLSDKERFILHAIEKSEEKSVKEIRGYLEMRPNSFSPYRERLAMEGIIDTHDYGKINFTLPRFGDFVNTMFEEENY